MKEWPQVLQGQMGPARRLLLSFQRDACGLDRKGHIQGEDESQAMLSASWEVTGHQKKPEELQRTQASSLWRRREGHSGSRFQKEVGLQGIILGRLPGKEERKGWGERSH